MVVSVTATYVHHDSYPSPIGVSDLTDWQTVYGTSISGSASDNNDGTMTGTVTVERAGTHTMTVQINSVNVIGSPFSFLDVGFTTFSGSKCVPLNVPTEMLAGFVYSFKI